MDNLIPEQLFQFLAVKSIWLIFATFVISLAALAKGADWLVEGASEIAKKLGIPTIIIGATIVSMGTTTPEAAVSVMAAFRGQPGLALGNGIGSVICDTALIFGLCCCITTLPVDKFILCRHGWIQFGAGVLFAGLCYILGFFEISYIGRTVGIILITALVCYMLISIRWARQHNERTGLDERRSAGKEKSSASPAKLASVFLLGLALVIAGSEVLIGSVNQICFRFGVPQAVIAATVVAFGTSLPELSVAIASIVKGHKELLIGNIIGADILNILFVIGASATAARLHIPAIFFSLHFPALVLILLLFRIYALTSQKTFKRWFGIPLLAIYAVYVITQYVIINS